MTDKLTYAIAKTKQDLEVIYQQLKVDFQQTKDENYELHFLSVNTILIQLDRILELIELEKHFEEKKKAIEEFNEKYFIPNKKDSIVEQVITKYRKRSQLGIKKYGTTLAENELTQEQWFTHLQEELMDAVLYLEKIKDELSN